MLSIRYSAMFTRESHPGAYAELAHSLAGVQLHVAPYAPARVIVYTSPAAEPSVRRLLARTELAHELLVLDPGADAAFAEAQAFAASIATATPVDRICIARMLTDFRLLPADGHRLLLGADVVFLDVPDELLEFAWQQRPRAGVAYAVDTVTFGGRRYRLRYWRGQLLDGLLGDLYCLAPGVSVPAEAVRGALRVIDSWPVERRYDPAIDPSWITCEQQAAAMVLAPFGGQELPPERYSHRKWRRGMAALHTHDLGRLPRYLKPEHARLAARLLADAGAPGADLRARVG